MQAMEDISDRVKFFLNSETIIVKFTYAKFETSGSSDGQVGKILLISLNIDLVS